jgi:hypothetical protein
MEIKHLGGFGRAMLRSRHALWRGQERKNGARPPHRCMPRAKKKTARSEAARGFEEGAADEATA